MNASHGSQLFPGASESPISLLNLTAFVFSTVTLAVFTPSALVFACKLLKRLSFAIPFIHDERDKSLDRCRELLIEGYRKYPTSSFRMPLFPFGNVLVLNSRRLINELQNASDDEFSFSAMTERLNHTAYTISPNVTKHHRSIVRYALSLNGHNIFDDVLDEMRGSFADIISLPDNLSGWHAFPAQDTSMKLVYRTSNRFFVSPALCRNEEYRTLTINFTLDAIKSAYHINLWPTFLHPIVAPLFATSGKYKRQLMPLLEPIVAERKINLATYGPNWPEKPRDYITWLLEEDDGNGIYTLDELARRVLHINLAAIHSSSMTLTHALLHLAHKPEYAEILREEAKRIIHEDGASLSIQLAHAMTNGSDTASVTRLAAKDYTFADGTHVPKGVFVTASLYSTHNDNEIYKDSSVFNPWRFSDLRAAEEGTEHGIKHQLIDLSSEFLAFGLGRHACPGRFISANQLKAMLCHIVLNYDVNLENEGVRPPNEYVGVSVRPNAHARIMFRRRTES
ncbi:hypothetical protein EW146_g5132 [Bondarzewia mesenterica]|uniref:Cytochrome P450 n=1 Tax=Bondarzewia mesenterica TaxID=1095465 RepID=A0A4V3XEY0_9AGAM|nr:hypothetical protein EW146_g5132 [Bondarzewia mesenterica]